MKYHHFSQKLDHKTKSMKHFMIEKKDKIDFIYLIELSINEKKKTVFELSIAISASIGRSQ